MYNLTESQKSLLHWFIEQVRINNLQEQFQIIWLYGGAKIVGLPGQIDIPSQITEGALQALSRDQLLICEELRDGVRCTLTGRAYEAIDSNFNAPDTSFIKHLTPLVDITNLDKELKERCLSVLSAGNDSKHWDVAVRQAFLILEERLRNVSGLPASEKNTSEILVNKVFGEASSIIADKAEKTSYRNLYSGVFTVFRNKYGHRFVDPSPEDGGAIITFINLLLKMLDDLRPPSSGSSS